jgi:hypothetical protein
MPIIGLNISHLLVGNTSKDLEHMSTIRDHSLQQKLIHTMTHSFDGNLLCSRKEDILNMVKDLQFIHQKINKCAQITIELRDRVLLLKNIL